MFGFTTISIDAKGRLAIPAKYRDHLQAKQETQIVVTRDPQYPALKIYPGSEWTQIAHGLQSLQGLDPIVRNLQWTILGNASVSELQIVVTRDPQYPALKIYPGSEWTQIAHGLQSLQGLDPIVRNLQWTILGNASVSEFDPSGRMLILVPSELREYADINASNKVALVGMGNKFEIWNDQNWEMRQTGGSLSTEILEVVLPESIKTMTF